MNGLSILMVNYNGALFLKNSVRSYRENLEKNSINYEFLIYDNASSDGSVEVIEDLKRESSLIKSYYSTINHGFAKANNVLSKYAMYDTLVFLNNDTVAIDIQDLCDHVTKSKLQSDSVYTCTILNQDGTTQRNVFLFPRLYKLISEIFLLKPILLKLFKADIKNKSDLNMVYFSGCYFILQKSLFAEVGRFDELFFFYHEECDLFIRLKAFHIKKQLLRDKIVHFGSGGKSISDFSFKNYYVNLFRLFTKHKYAKPWFIKFVFAVGFNFRVLLLLLNIKIQYSPFSQNYKSNYNSSDSFAKLIKLHRSTLSEILKL